MINWIASYKTPPPEDRAFVGRYFDGDVHYVKILCKSIHDGYYEAHLDSVASLYPTPRCWSEVSELGFPDADSCECERCYNP